MLDYTNSSILLYNECNALSSIRSIYKRAQVRHEMKVNHVTLLKLILTLLTANIPISCGCLKIGAFNIQTFGQAKYSNETLRNYLVTIVIKYDLILIQEIKDVSETMIFNFVKDCQAEKSSLDLIVSPRLGRTSYKEQYAIIYDKSKLRVTKHTVYDNPRALFSRPPITAHFTNSSPNLQFPDFTVFGVHIDPDDVVEELNEFPAAYDYALSRGYPARGIFMGDMNADCKYLSSKKYNDLLMTSDDRFLWFGDEDLDTTVSITTTCYYDRIVLCGDLDRGNFTRPSVDLFDGGMTNELAKKISDHYPIYVTWNTGAYNGGNTTDADTSSQAISHFRNILKEFICSCFPVLNKHKHEEWLESAVLFLSFVSIFILRRIVGYFNLVIT